MFFFKINSVYISISRSWPGVIFDSIVISLSKLLNKKIILHLHGNDFFLSSFQKRYFSRLYSKVDHFVVLSEPMKNYVTSFLSCPVIVILNPIQDIFFKEVFSKKREDDIIRVVFLSNIMKSKGIFDFIEIAKFFDKHGAKGKFEFHVIGRIGGDHEMNLDEISDVFFSEVSKVNNLLYHGAVYGENLSHLLSDMDLLIFPSFYPVEALPLSILECGAKGLYLVVNNHNDLPVFKQLFPEVLIEDTSNTELIFKLISSFSKNDIHSRGSFNKIRAIDYSLSNHINKFKEILI